jgi:hypothetical protein
LENGLDAGSHCFHCERLGQAGDSLKQEVTIREQPQHEAIHQILLADDNVTDLLTERWNPLTQFANFLRNFLRRFHTVSSDTHARGNVRLNVPQRADFPLISLANPLLPSWSSRESTSPE